MPNFPEGHPNRRLHGHSYTGEVVLEGPVDPASGVVMEIDELKRLLAPIVSLFDHNMLNDIPKLGLPTSENIAAYIFKELRAQTPLIKEVWIKRPTVGMSVCYQGE